MKSFGATEEQILANIRESIHWPMEGFISPAALAHVEKAIRSHVAGRYNGKLTGADMSPQQERELILLANNIRSHLQHVVADARKAAEPTDEELLS